MKSDYGLSASSGATKQQISEEERLVRWKYAQGEYPDMTEKQFKVMINKIRKSTGRP